MGVHLINTTTDEYRLIYAVTTRRPKNVSVKAGGYRDVVLGLDLANEWTNWEASWYALGSCAADPAIRNLLSHHRKPSMIIKAS